jgi:hypothetical protein
LTVLRIAIYLAPLAFTGSSKPSDIDSWRNASICAFRISGVLLLGAGNGIGASNNRRGGDCSPRYRDQCTRQLYRIAGLPPVLRLPELELLRPAFVVIPD